MSRDARAARLKVSGSRSLATNAQPSGRRSASPAPRPADWLSFAALGEPFKNNLCFRNQQVNSPSPFAPANTMKKTPLKVFARTLGFSLLPVVGFGAQPSSRLPGARNFNIPALVDQTNWPSIT